MFTTAIKNVAGSYGFQLRAGGSRLQRLSYVSAYWLCYFYAKYCGPAGGDWARAHMWALRVLGEAGFNRRLTRIRPSGRVELATDLLTAFMIVKEIYGDDMYEVGPDREFSPAAGAVIFDLGAQQGAFTVMAARLAENVKVIAVEPDPLNFERLKNNIALNGLTGAVVPVQAAVSNKTGVAQLYRNLNDSGCHTLSGGAGGEAVQVALTTLDRLAAEHKAAPNLIKIDVEGHTMEVFEGGLETIKRHLPDIVMEIENLGDIEKIASLLKSFGYDVRVRGNIALARCVKRSGKSRRPS